jgi:uncharacterized protein
VGILTPAQHFWTGCEKGELRVQCCADCNQAQFFPRDHCLHCHSDRVEWQASTGSGTIYSITRVERAPTDEFRALVPYAIALVDLDEGVRIMAHANAALQIGDKAKVTFFSHNNRSLPRFEPL